MFCPLTYQLENFEDKWGGKNKKIFGVYVSLLRGEAAKTKKAPTTPVSRRNERIKKDPMISLTESDSYYSIERAN